MESKKTPTTELPAAGNREKWIKIRGERLQMFDLCGTMGQTRALIFGVFEIWQGHVEVVVNRSIPLCLVPIRGPK